MQITEEMMNAGYDAMRSPHTNEPAPWIVLGTAAKVFEAMLAVSPVSGWQPIETAPSEGEFLVYGSYLYPDDTQITEYMAVGRSTNKPEYPIETHDGEALLGVFTHWQPLPVPPVTADTEAQRA